MVYIKHAFFCPFLLIHIFLWISRGFHGGNLWISTKGFASIFGLWITRKLYLKFRKVFNILINTEKPLFFKGKPGFTQIHGPYYEYYGI